MLAELLRYGATGVVNTLVGYGVFLAALRLLGLAPEAANALGYAVALALAFTLNRLVVFRGSRASPAAALRFALAFALAFAVNQAVLALLVRLAGVEAEIAQVAAMAAYTVLFYLLNKFFVFAR